MPEPIEEEKPTELVGFISLDQCDNDKFQLVYATQLYGTFYAVYAKFTTEIGSTRSKRKIKKIDFKGINYKGPLDLQLIKVHPPEQEDGGIQFKIDLQAIVQDPTPPASDAPLRVGPEPFKVDKSIDELKIDGSEIEFEKGDRLFILRNLKPMSDKTDPEKFEDQKLNKVNFREMAVVNGHFDSEYFFRDGIYIKPKMENADVDHFDLDDRVETAEDVPSAINTKLEAPGGKCPPSNLRVMF